MRTTLREMKEYDAWAQAIARCTNPKHPSYARYGGRGITVCPRWRAAFTNFLEDMGERPSSDHQLERKDNNRGYEPDNCCWATRKEQFRNRCDNRFVEFNGETLCIMDWAKRYGLNFSTLSHRLNIGWSPERAITTPKQRRLTQELMNQIREMLAQVMIREHIARKLGINSGSIRWMEMRDRKGNNGDSNK